jgi:hypothetical protein
MNEWLARQCTSFDHWVTPRERHGEFVARSLSFLMFYRDLKQDRFIPRQKALISLCFGYPSHGRSRIGCFNTNTFRLWQYILFRILQTPRGELEGTMPRYGEEKYSKCQVYPFSGWQSCGAGQFAGHGCALSIETEIFGFAKIESKGLKDTVRRLTVVMKASEVFSIFCLPRKGSDGQ